MQTSMRPATEVEPVTSDLIPFDEFVDNEFQWQQGEHVTILAPTGWGKTTLGKAILRKRKFVVVLATKPWDDTMSELMRSGYRVTEQWPPLPHHERVIFWPRIEKATDLEKQREDMKRVLKNIYQVGGWCVFLDELDYFCNYLKLAPLVELLWRQGRSLGISVVGGTQRPAFIPLLAYDQASHLFVGRDNDEVNLRRYAGLSGGDKSYQRQVKETVGALHQYRPNEFGDFMYLSTRREGFVTLKMA